MRILMVGRGVIAVIYGRAFHAAGHGVEFYVRPGRAEEYGDAVRIDLTDARRWPLGKRVKEIFPTSLRESFGLDDGFDLIVLSVPHHRLAEASALVAPRRGTATVLVLGNIWQEPLAAVAPLAGEDVVFGFPLAGGGFTSDGELRGGVLRSIIIGTGSPQSTRESQVLALFRHAGFAPRQEKDMRGWLFLHFVADAGMFAEAIRRGGMPNMIGDRRAFSTAFSTARELLPLLRARDVDLRVHRSSLVPFRYPRLIGTISAWMSALLPIARHSLAMHTDPHSTEALAVLDDTRREAHRLDIAIPRLEL